MFSSAFHFNFPYETLRDAVPTSRNFLIAMQSNMKEYLKKRKEMSLRQRVLNVAMTKSKKKIMVSGGPGRKTRRGKP